MTPYLVRVTTTVDGKNFSTVYLQGRTWLDEMLRMKDCFNERAILTATMAISPNGPKWVYSPLTN